MQKTLPYTPAAFVPIALLALSPTVLTVRLNFPANTAEEFIRYAKANPGKLNYASQGPGSTSHLTGVMFQQQTGSEMVHVPYRGTGPALADILAGNVDLFFDNLGSSMPMHRGGKAKILAVATPERSKLCRSFRPCAKRACAILRRAHGSRWSRRPARRRRSPSRSIAR